MVIYAEYLFAENFITGGLILILTGKVAGIQAKKQLLLLGSILCGLYSFILFWEGLVPWCAVILKILFSLGVILLVFPGKTLAQVTKRWLIFYLVSFALGGITVGGAYFIGYYGVTQNGSIYLEQFTYFHILSGCILSYLLLSALAKLLKGRLIRERTRAQVEVRMGDKLVRLQGLVDTGNHLRDPFTGKPVLVISLEAVKKLLPREIARIMEEEERTEVLYEELMKTDIAGRIRLIPYTSVGEDRGLLIGIKPDGLTIENTGDKKDGCGLQQNVILAVYKKGFEGEDNEEGYSILLHPNAMGGGLA